jgi:hypothetical protein
MDILNDPGVPQTGAEMVIYVPALKTSDLSFTVNASSMGDVVNYIATHSFPHISQDQNLRIFTLSGYPAASGVYMKSDTAGGPTIVYSIAVLRNDEIIGVLGLCPQTEWAQYQPIFDSILYSIVIIAP